MRMYIYERMYVYCRCLSMYMYGQTKGFISQMLRCAEVGEHIICTYGYMQNIQLSLNLLGAKSIKIGRSGGGGKWQVGWQSYLCVFISI